MKMYRYQFRWMWIVLLFVSFLIGCSNMSKVVYAESAGLNGSFENFENGLPVNWSMYSTDVVRDGDFSISADQSEFVEGKQSLKFVVKRCSDRGGRLSPGFSREFFEEGSGLFRFSGYVLNSKSHFRLSAGGVDAHHGNMTVLLENNSDDQNWQEFSYEVLVPTGSHLRIELNVLSPGVLRVDDIRIEKIKSA
jgi:hypothetical protein